MKLKQKLNRLRLLGILVASGRMSMCEYLGRCEVVLKKQIERR